MLYGAGSVGITMGDLGRLGDPVPVVCFGGFHDEMKDGMEKSKTAVGR